MRRVLVGLGRRQLGDGCGGRGLDVGHGQGRGWQGLLPRGLRGLQRRLRGRRLQGGVRVGRRLGGLRREAKGLRGAWVLQQRPGLEAVRAGWALTVQGGLGVGRAWGGAGRPGQRLQRGVR